MVENPDRIYIDENDRKLLKTIDESPEPEIKQLLSNPGRSRKEQFLYFLAVGVTNGAKIPLKKKDQGGFFLLKDLKTEDEAMINSVAMWHENSANILADRSKVLEIAEQYAHGGIQITAQAIESLQFGSFQKKLEQNLWNIFNQTGT